ncbi:MAG: hypothetical protein AAB884_00255 [Patescibacteria group bacterium]
MKPTQQKPARVSFVDDSNFDDLVIGASLPTVVVFRYLATGDGLTKTLEEFSRRLSQRVVFFELDANRSPGTARRFDVISFPYAMLFSRGVIERMVNERAILDLLWHLEERFGQKDE